MGNTYLSRSVITDSGTHSYGVVECSLVVECWAVTDGSELPFFVVHRPVMVGHS